MNELSKQVGALRRDGDDADAEGCRPRAGRSATPRRALADEHDEVERRSCATLLLRIPNLPAPDAPDGAGDADNPVVKGPVGLPDALPGPPAGAALGDRRPRSASSTTSGRRRSAGRCSRCSAALGATLARALCQLALDRNADAFEEIRPPTLVTTATLTATGQLPKFADDAYAIERDDLWCIPTAEVPLTSLYAGEILDEAELPMRLMAYTPCYRREAGSAGRDTRGHAARPRVRQGRDPRLRHARAGARPARRDDRPGRGDRSPRSACRTGSSRSAPATWARATTAASTSRSTRRASTRGSRSSSVIWFSDYQARRANIRYRPAGRARAREIVHTLNGSALAVPRVWAAIVENYRQPDGIGRRARGAAAVPARHRDDPVPDRRGVSDSMGLRRPAIGRTVRVGRPRRRRRRRRPDRAVAALVRRGRSPPGSPSRTP